MNAHHLARRAQALVIYKTSGGEAFTPAWLVDVLEKIPGVTAHAADQAAVRALASIETAEAVASALRAAADRADKEDGL